MIPAWQAVVGALALGIALFAAGYAIGYFEGREP